MKPRYAYLLWVLILWPALCLGQAPDLLDQAKKEGEVILYATMTVGDFLRRGVKSPSREIDQLLESENLHVIRPEGDYGRYMKLYNEILAVR